MVVSVIGRFVRFEALPLAGVPRAGVTKVGEVASTTLPEPVDATKLIVLGSVVPVFSMNPVVGAAGSVIMNLVVTLVGAMNPTLEVGAVVAVPCAPAQNPPTPEPTPVVMDPGVEKLPLESSVVVAEGVWTV